MLYLQEAVVEALQVVRKAKQIQIDNIGCDDDDDEGGGQWWWYGIYRGCYWQYDFRIVKRLI